ncbi:hypothetical protein BDQ12DRAFT_676385 [Crucibulum laeve]|uniref:SAP domain-containing protein n=1 Tax=Crucibulum laeve TaxID=68775 RepID=A0A5C3MAV4_9AGAR|nr:hypothetical protein BDQ12DRAFT_676385 [Crucibulum laeve]
MLSLARLSATVARPALRRNFVSSVLLTRTWENESVAELRKEAKGRGLPAKGNKATLILRIQEHDKSKTLDAIASHDPPVPSGVRNVSTISSSASKPSFPPDEETGVSPGIPAAAEPHVTPPPELVFQVNIPDLSQPIPETPIEIPYLPDFWDSSALKTPVPEVEEILPKMVVVGGAGTHHGGGPSHNLSSAEEYVTPAESRKTPGQGGIWDDITEDIGIPAPKEIKSAIWKLFS